MVKIKVTNKWGIGIQCKGTARDRIKGCSLAVAAAIGQIIAASDKATAEEIVRQIFSEDAKNPVTAATDNGETTERFN